MLQFYLSKAAKTWNCLQGAKLSTQKVGHRFYFRYGLSFHLSPGFRKSHLVEQFSKNCLQSSTDSAKSEKKHVFLEKKMPFLKPTRFHRVESVSFKTTLTKGTRKKLGGFKRVLFTSLLGEDELILTNIFQMGWNRQLEKHTTKKNSWSDLGGPTSFSCFPEWTNLFSYMKGIKKGFGIFARTFGKWFPLFFQKSSSNGVAQLQLASHFDFACLPITSLWFTWFWANRGPHRKSRYEMMGKSCQGILGSRVSWVLVIATADIWMGYISDVM